MVVIYLGRDKDDGEPYNQAMVFTRFRIHSPLPTLAAKMLALTVKYRCFALVVSTKGHAFVMI